MTLTIKIPTKTSSGTEHIEVLTINEENGVLTPTITAPPALTEKAQTILLNFQEGFEFTEESGLGIQTLSLNDGSIFIKALLASSNAYLLVEQSQ